MDFAQIMVVAVLAEAVLESLKPIWDSTKRENIAEFYVALGLGVVIAFLGGIDAFEASGVPLTFFEFLGPYPGVFFTGIILGRGGSYVHDLLKAVQAIGK
jgi:hypothetical protein